jgi:hypothetical protein
MTKMAKAAKAKVNKAPKHNAAPDALGLGFTTPNTKCQHSGKLADATPLADNLLGTLIYMGSNIMPSINEANPAMRICAAHQRVSCNCPRSSACKMIHDLDITKWPEATFAKW